MFILDTNVVSEAMKPEPVANVVSWLNDQAAETLYLSSVTFAELLHGVHALPLGKRKVMLDRALTGLLDLFKDRVLSFDTEAARCYAELAVTARQNGRGFFTPDGYIAAIAASKNLFVASRNTSAFVAAGLKVINPWQETDYRLKMPPCDAVSTVKPSGQFLLLPMQCPPATAPVESAVGYVSLVSVKTAD